MPSACSGHERKCLKHAQCQFLFMTKEQLKHYCYEEKRPGTDGVALATIFST